MLYGYSVRMHNKWYTFGATDLYHTISGLNYSNKET